MMIFNQCFLDRDVTACLTCVFASQFPIQPPLSAMMCGLAAVCMFCDWDNACDDVGSATQVTSRSSVGITNTTFIGNVDGNSQGGAFAAGLGGLVQVC